MVDEVIVKQLGHVPKEERRQLLVGRACRPPARDGDVVQARRAGYVSEPIPHDTKPAEVVELLDLHDDLGPALDARGTVVQVDGVVPRRWFGRVSHVRGLRVSARVPLEHRPVLAVLDFPATRHAVAEAMPPTTSPMMCTSGTLDGGPRCAELRKDAVLSGSRRILR
eukprot:CAMPEP_0205911362 /NCGR_PEP_ID=MMETSP1325-20131115/5100_1 /ASSEMBLY_ACC=CAM_ASM_000708 /TAXON_ID=236786 /ORGANISM="Florenciella sp., Strain RCC1007" /LENGTH=166 /DNA_ID=CAMNT_0053277879 /DNA_START=287 /DNA_END=785 /DNA_ORIENTATION=+